MSSDTAKRHELFSALEDAQGKANGSFEQAVTHALEHVFEHLDRSNAHVSTSGLEGGERALKPDESPTLG